MKKHVNCEFRKQNRLLRTENSKLKKEVSHLTEEKERLIAECNELKKLVAENTANKETAQKNENKKKWIAGTVRNVYFFGEIAIFLILTYGNATDNMGDAFVDAIIVGLILVGAILLLSAIPGNSTTNFITTYTSAFINFMGDMAQNLIPMLLTSTLLWIKRGGGLANNKNYIDYLVANIPFMGALLGLVVAIFVFMIIVAGLSSLFIVLLWSVKTSLANVQTNYYGHNIFSLRI